LVGDVSSWNSTHNSWRMSPSPQLALKNGHITNYHFDDIFENMGQGNYILLRSIGLSLYLILIFLSYTKYSVLTVRLCVLAVFLSYSQYSVLTVSSLYEVRVAADQAAEYQTESDSDRGASMKQTRILLHHQTDSV